MAKSEAQRKASNKYDLNHYSIVACKMKKEEADSFKEECKKRNTTPNSVLKDAIQKFMENA